MSIQFTLAWRYLWGRKLRTVLTIISITLGVMLIFGLSGIMPTIVKAFETATMAAAGRNHPLNAARPAARSLSR